MTSASVLPAPALLSHTICASNGAVLLLVNLTNAPVSIKLNTGHILVLAPSAFMVHAQGPTGRIYLKEQPMQLSLPQTTTSPLLYEFPTRAPRVFHLVPRAFLPYFAPLDGSIIGLTPEVLITAKDLTAWARYRRHRFGESTKELK